MKTLLLVDIPFVSSEAFIVLGAQASVTETPT